MARIPAQGSLGSGQWRLVWGWEGGAGPRSSQGKAGRTVGGAIQASLGREAEDADTIWALPQNGSMFVSQQLMRFLTVDGKMVSSLSLGVCKQGAG